MRKPRGLAALSMPAAMPAEAAAPEPPRAAAGGIKTHLLYLPAATKKDIARWCLEHDVSVQDFLLEGVDLRLAAAGLPSIEQRRRELGIEEKGKKKRPG